MPRSLFAFASIYLVATIVFHVSSRIVAASPGSTEGISALWIGMMAFCVLCVSMWMLYRAIPSPGMLCCAMAVNVLGLAAALDVGMLDHLLGRSTAADLSVHATITAIVLLAASVLLMPRGIVAYFRIVILPALLGRPKR